MVVVDVDTGARTAQGLLMGQARTTVELTKAQAQEAGLPHSHAYRVTGMLLDADDEPVLPRVTALSVPIRWLHPQDTPVSPGHHDTSVHHFG
ncbi:hypothetical protein [Streptomyces sp. DSM 118148]|uniref:hypothetical protein n=1 Tax=Streptomyces sp. DSM 118148 TaxID=3448667 RepID=UPI004040042D